MLRNAGAWIRQHPIRCVVYTLLIAAGVWGGVTTRGILRGERNQLLTRVAQWKWLQGWVERDFHVRYYLREVGVLPECGFRVYVRGASVELIGAATATLEEARVCLSGSGELRGITVGPQTIGLQSVQFEWPKSIQGEQFVWSDTNGALVTAGGFHAAPGTISGGIENLQVLSFLRLEAASLVLAALPGSSIAVRQGEAHNARVVVDQQALAQAPARFRAAAAALNSMAVASLPFPIQWLAAARRLLVWFLVIAAALLLCLKVFVTRVPAAVLWRLPIVLAPFAVAALLALTRSGLVAILIAAPTVAIALWAVAYRRSEEWHQRWEPAAVDLPTVLLALPLFALLAWPNVKMPQLPQINQVTVARFDLLDTVAAIRAPECGSGDTAEVAISQASMTNLRVALDGSVAKSIDADRITASGEVRTRALDGLRRIRYLPAEWKTTPPVSFCADATIVNSGAGELPQPACPPRVKSPGALVRAAVDYTGRRARFAADGTGGAATFTVGGSAGIDGAQIDDLRIAYGAAVRIARGSGRVTWPSAVAANLQLEGIQANGAAIEQIALNASSPFPCRTGPLHVAAHIGKVRSSFGGSQVDLAGANFEFERPDTSRILSTTQLGAIAVSGPFELSTPGAELRFEGATSRQPIPQNLSGTVSFAAGSLGIAEPVHFTADLWTGTWQLERQPVLVRQSVTSRVPQSIALNVEASGTIASLASPVQANASGSATVPVLVPDVAPASVELRDVHIQGAWDSTGSAVPVKISSGWNLARFPEVPNGIALNEVSGLHLAARGEATELPTFAVSLPAAPTIPREITFRLQGTPQSIVLTTGGGEQLAIEHAEAHDIKVSLPELKFQSLELEGSARIRRGGTEFPVSARAQIHDAGIHASLLQPLPADIDAKPDSVVVALTGILKSAELLDEVGIKIEGIQPQATVTDLHAEAKFSDKRLAGFDVAGALAEGPLVTVKDLQVSQKAPSTFHFSALVLPQATVNISAPAVEVALNGGKLHTSLAFETSAALTLAPSSSSPLASRLQEAAAGIWDHADRARQIFGNSSASIAPVRWDLEVNSGSTALSMTPGKLSVHLNTAIHRLEAGQQTIEGTTDLTADAQIVDDHLLLDLNPATDLIALGRRWELNTPVLLELRKELRPGSGGELFDSNYYQHLAGARPDGAIRIAIGYGAALQAHSAFNGTLLFGQGAGIGQAAVRWQPGAASINGFGRFSFQGLEAGAVALPDPFLEDRLDGEARVRARDFLVDRSFLPQLQTDISRLSSLDGIDLSLSVRSAADRQRMPGVAQAESGLTLKPANEFLRLLTDQLNLNFPPRAVRYQSMSLDFHVEQGRIVTGPALLTLRGVQAIGVNGLNVDSNIRVFWGGHGAEPAPRLRDLVYTLQRAMEP